MQGDPGSDAGVDRGSGSVERSPVSGLLLTGGVGAGKTTLAVEVGELLRAHRVAHAVIDLDWLGWCAVSFDGAAQLQRRRLLAENLAAVWGNYRQQGVSRAVLAGSIVSAEHLGAVRRAIGNIPLRVIRIAVPVELALERLELRDPGSKTVGSIGELRSFSEVVSAAGVESGVVENTGRDPSVTARQIVQMSGWVASGGERR